MTVTYVSQDGDLVHAGNRQQLGAVGLEYAGAFLKRLWGRIHEYRRARVGCVTNILSPSGG